jgi:hypothetical protein
MKKITALVALALLAIAGTGFAVTCAQDNVPAATLLVPYFRVGGAGVVGFNDIPDTSGTDTLVAVTNVSSANIIIHVTVWNKYSVGVLDFNVPMTGYDVVFWSMRDILNGKLNVNPAFQNLALLGGQDPCGQEYVGGSYVGFSTTPFIRFAPVETNDILGSISVYANPAFSGVFRQNVWTSLDESYDISNWLTAGTAGGGVLDANNFACGSAVGSAVVGDFSGYVTIDVANFCTQHFPDDGLYYRHDAIATIGWGTYPGPNILTGDVFYKDQQAGATTATIGNISGDQTVALEFDSRLPLANNKTFYGRFVDPLDSAVSLNANATAGGYAFSGDGREPLGTAFAFRYMQTTAPTALRTWINVWRGDHYDNLASHKNLCGWERGVSGFSGGFVDTTHDIGIKVYDNDENTVTSSGGPSGGPTGGKLYIYLEAQRLVVTPNANVIQSNFLGGWVNLALPGNAQEQAFIEVQHSGLGLAMSVGHAAPLLDGRFVCVPVPTVTFPAPGTIVDGHVSVQTN